LPNAGRPKVDTDRLVRIAVDTEVFHPWHVFLLLCSYPFHRGNVFAIATEHVGEDAKITLISKHQERAIHRFLRHSAFPPIL